MMGCMMGAVDADWAVGSSLRYTITAHTTDVTWRDEI